MNTLFRLFMAFFRIGLFGFGGGQASIPLIEKEAVENYKWLSVEEFTDSVAFSNSLPGPIATKLAALIGYKSYGFFGMLVSIIGVVLPSAVLIILLLSLYQKYKTESWLQGMMKGVRPVVVVLIFQVVLLMGKTSFTNLATVIIAFAAILMVYVFNFHPAVTILLALIFGGFFLR